MHAVTQPQRQWQTQRLAPSKADSLTTASCKKLLNTYLVPQASAHAHACLIGPQDCHPTVPQLSNFTLIAG